MPVMVNSPFPAMIKRAEIIHIFSFAPKHISTIATFAACQNT